MKKHGKILRSLVSLTLVFSLCFSMFSLPAAAENNAADTQAVVDSGDLTVTSENSVGDLLANTINENQQDASEACYVTDLEITDSTAAVSFQTLVDSDIVVGIYTEDGKQLLASGTAAVTSEEDSVSVTLSGEMPEYFVASAYLLDAESHQPLSEEYTTQLYTYEMQQLISKTADDFEQERVVLLDDTRETNFAVLSEDTVFVDENVDKNIFTDHGDGTYTIANADDAVLALQPGDVFTYSQGNDQYVIVVASVSVNGTTVDITEQADADLTDAFQYVKIEAESEIGDITYGGEILARNVTDVSTYAMFDEDDPFDWSDTQTLDIVDIDKPNIKGSVSLKIKESIICYTIDENLYLRVQIDLQLPVDLKITGSCDEKLPFKEVGFKPLTCVWIGFTPSLVLQANGTLKLETGLEATVGIEFDSRKADPFTNISEKPHLMDNPVLEMNATLYVGISLKPEMKLQLDFFGLGSLDLVSGYISGDTGLQVAGVLDTALSGQPENTIHDCLEGTGCISGKMDWIVTVKAGLSIAFVKEPWEKELLKNTYNIGIFYYSITHSQFGWGDCPFCFYKVTVQALDKEGKPLANAEIGGTFLEEAPVTDENGEVSFYLERGNYTFTIHQGEDIGSRYLWVGQPIETTIQLKDPVFSGGNYGNGGVNIAISGLEDIIFDTEDQEGAGDEGTEPVEKVTWVLTNGKLIISGNGPMEDYYSYSTVPWYDDRASITSVYIESGVTSIGRYAFYGCSNLKSVTISDGVTSIGRYAFYGCSSLKSVTIPEGVTSIGGYTFYECSNLTSVVIPEGVTSIEQSAFSECSSLIDITVPEGVTSIGSWSFSNCSSLISITIPEGVSSIGNNAFSGCSNMTNITISEGVSSIGFSAFSGCSSLISIVLPKGVTEIDSYTFINCTSLIRIVIPEGVISIGYEAFANCSQLINVMIPNGLKTIDGCAFYGCSSMTDITIPEGVTTIGDRAFANCTSLTSVGMSKGLISIGESAFYGCSSLKSVVLPENLTSIGEFAFYKCNSLIDITIPEGVTTIGNSVFSGCSSITSITIPEGVTTIGNSAFSGCSSITSITIPEGVTTIGNSAFSGCSSITSITIPEGVTTIENRVFYGCSSVTNITIPEGVTIIRDSAFSGCSSITNITIPEGVTTIGYGAFYGCSSMTDITIPENVESIEDSTFSECRSLVNVILPESVTSIGRFAFSRCDHLTSIKIPKWITSISQYAFRECKNLSYIVIPKATTLIDSYAFYKCSSLTDVYYAGDEADWNAITIESYNKDLTSATIHYNSTGPTAEELAVLIEAANLNSIPDSDFDSDIQDGYLSEFEQQEEDFGLLEDQPDIDDPAFSEDEQLSHMSSMEQTFTEPPMDEGSSTLPFTTGSGQQIQSKFSNLVANEEYVLIVARDITADHLFAVDNLLYIVQGTADTSGSLSFEYFLPEDLDVSGIYARAFGKSNKDLANATVVVDPAVYDGMAQTPDPIVVYDGMVLQEGFDYTVSYSNNDKVGTGYVTVIGKIGYTGSKTVPFTITNGVSIVGDLNYDGSVDARDLVLLTRYVAGWNVSIREDLADVNGDDAVDGQDVIMLTRYLAGWGDAYKPVA